MLSHTAFDRLANQSTAGFVTNVDRDRWILHAPGNFLVVACPESIIEAHEKAAGCVSKAELMEQLSRHAELAPKWDTSTKAQLATLADRV